MMKKSMESLNLNHVCKTYNCDFEKGAMNAAQRVFKYSICGCFFHYSQSEWRHVQFNGLTKKFFSFDPNFRLAFKKVQALAYIPIEGVIDGFLLIQKESPKSFNPILKWLENNYIGKLEGCSTTARKEPRFPIKVWNVYERVKKDLPRTNNLVESWYSVINADTRKNLTVNKTVELCRKEQGNMEAEFQKCISGDKQPKPPNSRRTREENIKRIVMNYKRAHLADNLLGLANNMGEVKIRNLAKTVQHLFIYI